MIRDMHAQISRMETGFNDKLEETHKNVSQAELDLCKHYFLSQYTLSVNLRKERSQVGGEKDTVLETKHAEITALGLKIETLAFEFSEMIRGVITQLSERIDVTHTSGDQVGRLPLLMQIENNYNSKRAINK